jgi:hypothetical protein
MVFHGEGFLFSGKTCHRRERKVEETSVLLSLISSANRQLTTEH